VSGKDTSGKSGGIGFIGLLQIVFITLKLTGYINWSWWWVLSPCWLTAAWVVFVFAVGMAVVAIMNYARNARLQREAYEWKRTKEAERAQMRVGRS
jgi:hypothetical protein